MTQENVKERINLYAKKKHINFENDDIVFKMSSYITNPIVIEYYQQDRLKQLFSLFNGIKIGRGELIYDERNGKAVCTKIKSEIKKFMAIYFETLKGKFYSKYNVYDFIIDDRNMD